MRRRASMKMRAMSSPPMTPASSALSTRIRRPVFAPPDDELSSDVVCAEWLDPPPELLDELLELDDGVPVAVPDDGITG
jgi:hypothetical protein